MRGVSALCRAAHFHIEAAFPSRQEMLPFPTTAATSATTREITHEKPVQVDRQTRERNGASLLRHTLNINYGYPRFQITRTTSKY